MQLFCPTCQAAFPGVSRCPKCGGLLLLPQEAVGTRPRFGGTPADEPRPTSIGRIVVGTVVALGLYLALRKMATAWVLAHQIDPEAWWASIDGLSAVFTAQGLAAVVGAILAAAGRGGGFAVGAAVGSVCGGLFLAAELLTGAPGRDLVFYLQPPILAFVGGVAGAVSTRIWVAPPTLDMPTPAATGSKLSSLQLAAPTSAHGGQPTQWARVLLGAIVMTLGFAMAEKVRTGAQKYSGGMLQAKSLAQGQFMSWQLALLAVMIGGGTAAASTGAGVRHGAIAGLIAGAAAVGLNVQRGGPNAPSEYWLDKLSLGGLPPLDPYSALGVAGGVWLAAVVGGWLGAQLLPPLVPEHMRDRRFKLGGD